MRNGVTVMIKVLVMVRVRACFRSSFPQFSRCIPHSTKCLQTTGSYALRTCSSGALHLSDRHSVPHTAAARCVTAKNTATDQSPTSFTTCHRDKIDVSQINRSKTSHYTAVNMDGRMFTVAVTITSQPAALAPFCARPAPALDPEVILYKHEKIVKAISRKIGFIT